MIFSFRCFRKASDALGLSHLGKGCLYFEDKKLKIIRDNIFVWFYFAKAWDLEWILKGGEWEEGWWKKGNGYFLQHRMDMDIDSPTCSKNSVPTLWESFENDHLILNSDQDSQAWQRHLFSEDNTMSFLSMKMSY